MLAHKQASGFTLVELMISLAIGSFVALSAVTYFMITFQASFNTQTRAARTTEFTRTEFVISSAIRRAGFLSSTGNMISHLQATGDDNTFTDVISTSTDCAILNFGTDTDPDKQVGFKRENDVMKTLIGAEGEVLACNSGSWLPITSTNALFYKTFSITDGDTRYYNADDPNLAILSPAACTGSSRTTNCLITKIWTLELCALPTDAASCSDEAGSYYTSITIAPRNPILLGAWSG
jgi:prepilin-type N-terminal cleavage/methylation domain-containing protein